MGGFFEKCRHAFAGCFTSFLRLSGRFSAYTDSTASNDDGSNSCAGIANGNFDSIRNYNN